MSGTLFLTGSRSYLQRDVSSGSSTMAAPATLGYGLNIYYTNFVVAHNLGYVPFFRAAYEAFQDGVVWPTMGTRLSSSVVNPLDTSGATGPSLVAWADSTNLTLQLCSPNNSLTGLYTVYWVIYKGPQL